MKVRLGISALAAAALVPLTATAALAAPPANDTPDGAVALILGDTVRQDTSQATTDARDAKLNQACGAPHTNASVWYTYTPKRDGAFVLDMSKSDYAGGFLAFKGAPSVKTLLTCGPTTIGIKGRAGTTYTFMVISDTKVNGGNLVLKLTAAPPTPKVIVSLNQNGLAYGDGTARLSGTFTCMNADFIDLEGQLQQIWRRVKITGYFGKFYSGEVCNGRAHYWKALVTSDNGLFAAGDATANMYADVCGPFTCREAVVDNQQVTLGVGGSHAPMGLQAAATPSAPRSAGCSPTKPLYSRSLACRFATLHP